MIRGGFPACHALFHELGARVRSEPALRAVHRLLVDTYCLQHVESYCESAKSYAAHLTGLCCGIEYGGVPAVYAAIPRWLNGRVQLTKPLILQHRGALTLPDVALVAEPTEQTQRVQAWAHDVWDAYASQHALARTWLDTALGSRSSKRR